MKKVEITWLDSHAWSGGWMTVEDAMKKIADAKPIISTGFVLHEDDTYISIVQNQDKNGYVSMLYRIPKSSIITIC